MAGYKLQFTAVIEKQGPNPYVDVPDLPADIVDVHVHLLRVTRPEDLDDEVMEWVRESYRVGAQERG